jgi:hypothetical protein
MHRRTRVHYWSHGWVYKLAANWLGAPPRPISATMQEWNVFDKNQKKHFNKLEIVESLLDKLQNIWMFPGDVYHTIYVYIRNRFVHKIHVLRTDLKPGKYAEYETRLLHGMFNSFVEFIEDEQTLDNLKWEMTLTNKYQWLPEEEAKQQSDYGALDSQAITAMEKMTLYTWWKVTRPTRVDGYIASGYKAFSESCKTDDDNVFSFIVEESDTNNSKIRLELRAKWREIDEQQDQEDEDMMIRLIKLRGNLWT